MYRTCIEYNANTHGTRIGHLVNMPTKGIGYCVDVHGKFVEWSFGVRHTLEHANPVQLFIKKRKNKPYSQEHRTHRMQTLQSVSQLLDLQGK